MSAETLVRKVRALQTKTVANGATEAEAAEAQAAVARLEAKLGYRVQPAAPTSSHLGLRGRIYRAQASDWQAQRREADRRKQEAMNHIIGLRR